MFSRVGIVRGQAPLSIANSPLPDLVEKLPDAGFIAEMPFGIIVRNNETSRICSADAASSVESCFSRCSSCFQNGKEALSHYREMLESMGRPGIKVRPHSTPRPHRTPDVYLLQSSSLRPSKREKCREFPVTSVAS